MKPEHLMIETIGAAPVGGQQCGVIPKTVKVTHVPTGITASCGYQRSQMRNRNVCLAMIEYGLAEMGIDSNE